MEIKNIISCLQTNGISYPDKFATIEKDGCIAVFSGLLETNLNRIDSMVRYGSNNGFSSDLKTEITKMIKLTCKMCQEKKAKKHDKYASESEKIYKETEKIMKEKEGQFDMVNKVNKHIDTYISGMRVLQNMPVAEDRKPILQQGIDKCEQIKKVLSEVMNNSTTTALEYAKTIISELQTWADIVANKMHDESDLPLLDNALKTAEKWKANHDVVKNPGLFTKGNKVKDISELEFKEDNLSMIAKSVAVEREIGYFKENLEEYRKNTCVGSDEQIKNSLESKKEEKAKLEAQKKDLAIKFQNGEISKMDLYEECIDIDQQIDDIKEDIEDLKYQLEEKKIDTRSTGKVLETLESLNNQVLSYKADPISFALLGEELDFDKLTKVMRGTGNDADVEYVLGVQSILDRVKARRQKMDGNMVSRAREKMREKNMQRKAERQARLDEQMQTRNQERQENQQKADDYIAQLLGQTNKPQTETQTNTQTQETIAEENTRIALGDDEL